MQYAVVRVVDNDRGYKQPSGGKLGRKVESQYARENGFGHEEWNFNREMAVNERVGGYHYYQPAERKRNLTFTLYFVTYTNSTWYLVGVYRNAKYHPEGTTSTDAGTREKVRDLRSLEHELGSVWRGLSSTEMFSKLKHEDQYKRWSVHVDDMVVAPEIVEVRSPMKFKKNFHETTATFISASEARELDSLLPSEKASRNTTVVVSIDNKPPEDVDAEAIEGNRRLVSHFRRERNQRLVRKKKRSVLDETKKLSCEVCAFDFEAFYGSHGNEFCEVHHLRPLAETDEQGELPTKLSDLAIVCSNCHRMLHRGVDVLTIKALRKMIGRSEP